MAVNKKGKYWYGEKQDDIAHEIRRYSKSGYPALHYANARCRCGHAIFRLSLDDDQGAAVRTCDHCGREHAIGDSAEYLAEAQLQTCACPCGEERLEITVGIAPYDDGQAVRWLYVGCRCPQCGLVAVYGDWKNEFEDYQGLLANV